MKSNKGSFCGQTQLRLCYAFLVNNAIVTIFREVRRVISDVEYYVADCTDRGVGQDADQVGLLVLVEHFLGIPLVDLDANDWQMQLVISMRLDQIKLQASKAPILVGVQQRCDRFNMHAWLIMCFESLQVR